MHRSLHWGVIVCCAAMASACSVLPEPSPAPGSGSATAPVKPRPMQKCDQAGAQWALGKTNTEYNINEARKRAGAHMARVLRPGQPTTREFNVERLNLEVDATGRIIKAFCG